MKLSNSFGGWARGVANRPAFSWMVNNRLSSLLGVQRLLGRQQQNVASPQPHEDLFLPSQVVAAESRARQMAGTSDRPALLVDTAPVLTPSPAALSLWSKLRPKSRIVSAKEADDKFNHNTILEHVGMYTVGGLVEGAGKALQREGFTTRFLDHPVAGPIFKPLYLGARSIIEARRDGPVEGKELDAALKEMGKSIAGVGNWIKVGVNVIIGAMNLFLARKAGVASAKLQTSAAKFASIKNVAYITEKTTMALGFSLAAAHHMNAAIAVLGINQVAILVASGMAIASNMPTIRRGIIPWLPIIGDKAKQSDDTLRKARDCLKGVSVYAAKTIWAACTLWRFGAQNATPLISDGTLIPQEQNFDILAQNNWELPVVGNAVGLILMTGVPMAFGAYHLYHAGKVAFGKREQDAQAGVANSLSYYLHGAAADALGALGGYWTAFLYWQPLGAVPLGFGSIFQLLQSRAARKTGESPPSSDGMRNDSIPPSSSAVDKIAAPAAS